MPPGARSAESRQAAGIATSILGFLVMFLEAMLIPSAWLAVVVVALTVAALYWILVKSAG